MVVSPETMGMLISVRGKAQTGLLWLENVHCPLVKTQLCCKRNSQGIHFSWKVNIFCHSIIIAQVSCCFRRTSQCAHRTTQPDLIYVHRAGEKNSFFSPLVLQSSWILVSSWACWTVLSLYCCDSFTYISASWQASNTWCCGLKFTLCSSFSTIPSTPSSPCNFRSAHEIGNCRLQIFMHVTRHAAGLMLIGKSGRTIGTSSV